MTSLVFRILDAHVIHGRADEIAISDERGTTSYAELLHESASIGAGLHHMGIEAGTFVTVDLPPGRDLVVTVLAMARIGAIPADSADFRLVGTPPVLHAPATEVAWDLLVKAGRVEPHPAPADDPDGYEELMRAAFGDILEVLEAGRTIG
ncbi:MULTISPECIES: AMP-binding protein [Aeromicrobium]|nr:MULTISPECIES: AMP-binding protein [Aeromicrobium]